MSKKAWICCGGCLIAGVVIGYCVAMAKYGNTLANTLACLEMTQSGVATDRAFEAYQHESIPVAIYALAEALDRLKTAEDFGVTPYMTKQTMAFDGLMLHGRLAKLYMVIGQTNLSEQQVSGAIICAKDIPACRAITNQVALMKLIAKADKGAE